MGLLGKGVVGKANAHAAGERVVGPEVLGRVGNESPRRRADDLPKIVWCPMLDDIGELGVGTREGDNCPLQPPSSVRIGKGTQGFRTANAAAAARVASAAHRQSSSLYTYVSHWRSKNNTSRVSFAPPFAIAASHKPLVRHVHNVHADVQMGYGRRRLITIRLPSALGLGASAIPAERASPNPSWCALQAGR